MLPNFLIIGAPRAGTTWLAKNLREHPEVFMPAEKELHFFDRHYERGQDYYEGLFSGASTGRAVGEATPEYLYLPEVPGRIHEMVPDCRLILSLRDPVERLYSRYWNSKAKYRENRSLSFEEKLKAKPLFIEEGMYFTHLRRYYQFFAPEQFLILLYEDIQAAPVETLRRTYAFLGVDPSFVSSRIDDRINAASTKAFLAKSRSVYYLGKAAEKLGLKNMARRLSHQNAGDLPSMAPETRQWLAQEVYADENRKLRELTGIDTGRWSQR